MKIVSKTYKERLILSFFIAFLLCSVFGGTLENAQPAIVRQIVFHTPYTDGAASDRENYTRGVHVPFVLAENADAHRLFLNRVFSSSGKNEKAKRNHAFVILPFSKWQGNTMCSFGTWQNAIGRSLVVFAQYIIISYIHLQDGLK